VAVIRRVRWQAARRHNDHVTTTQAERSARSWPASWFGGVTWLLGGLLLAFIVLPIIRLVTTSSVASLHAAASTAAVRDATLLSLQAAAITAGIAILFGVPLAYLLARGSFRGRGVIQSLVDLPLVVPHTVAGIALLFLLGRTGWVGAPVGHRGRDAVRQRAVRR
jgi:molybdate/tungstate transport system permease protein